MTTNHGAGSEAGSSPGLGDIPGGRPDSLDAFDVLVGTWDMEASFEAGKFGPGSPAVTARSASTVFEWLEGRWFLVQRFTSQNPAAPSGIAIIGPAATPAATLKQHYFDSRGVARIYETALDGRTWTVWREAPGAWQRYTGTVSADGSEIVGAWEMSRDGRHWTRDFGLRYIRVVE